MHAAACSSHAASGDTETTRTPGCPRDSAGARTHAAPGRAAPAGARRNSDTAPRTACCRNSSAMSPPNSSPLKRVNLRAPGREARGPTIEGSEADRMCTAVRPLSLRAAYTGGACPAGPPSGCHSHMRHACQGTFRLWRARRGGGGGGGPRGTAHRSMYRQAPPSARATRKSAVHRQTQVAQGRKRCGPRPGWPVCRHTARHHTRASTHSK